LHELALAAGGRLKTKRLTARKAAKPSLTIRRDGSIHDHLEYLKLGIGQRSPQKRARARRSWDIYCEIIKRIADEGIRPVKAAYDPQGKIDPRRTLIETSYLLALAAERQEKPKYLIPLVKAGVGEQKPLGPAPAHKINSTINAVYNEAEAAGHKPPNVKEIVAPVQEKLKAQGFETSDRQIENLAGAKVYQKRRWKPGETVAHKRRKKPQ
jgi:hypothetical protein